MLGHSLSVPKSSRTTFFSLSENWESCTTHRCTKPDAFFLDVFFNAFVAQPESRDKQRAPNALVPSVVAYAGGQMEFKVDMGLVS
jgi:hypothetical protein